MQTHRTPKPTERLPTMSTAILVCSNEISLLLYRPPLPSPSPVWRLFASARLPLWPAVETAWSELHRDLLSSTLAWWRETLSAFPTQTHNADRDFGPSPFRARGPL